MNLLLDTHVLIWWLAGDNRLSRAARTAIGDTSNVIHVSAVSIWEITIKQSRGRLAVPENLPSVVEEAGFLPLSITAAHAWALRRLPPHHADPFDRMLLAQATVEQLTLVSQDAAMAAYSVPLIS